MGRKPCCAKEGLNRGAWTAMEDKTLVDYINTHGEGNWRNLPRKAGLKRCGKSCRLRWLNYLRPGIKRGNITTDEEELIIRLHKLLGNRWSLIAGRLPGRTDNEIKNYWNTNIGKKLNHTQKLQHKTTSTKSSPRKQTKSAPNPSTTRLNNVDESNVIRTKASRCTKVFIFPRELQNPQDNNVSNTEPDSTVHYTPLPPEENLSTGSMVDCEMDRQLLSDLLMIETDDNTFCDNGAGHSDNVNYCNQLTQFSPDSDTNNHHQSLSFPENLQLPEDLLQHDDLDISSMASLIEFEFDWLGEI